VEKAEYDLIIAGAGPAGSACAIRAARMGARVLLLEKDHLPRHKVCGEFVSPESLKLLEWLLGEKQFHERPEIGSARIFSGRTAVSLPISPPARSIPRFDLDAALLDAARRAGADAKEGTIIREVEEGATFKVRSAGKTFAARAVVNASGRWSQLTRPPAGKNGVEKNKTKWIGIKGHFHEAVPAPSVDLYFFEGGYCGVQPVSGDTVNASAMVRADAARSMEEVLSRHKELRQRSEHWQPVFPPITTSQLYFRPPQTESSGMLLAGDAAAFIDPFAGDGISLALHSGTLAAESLMPFFQGKVSLEEARRDYHAGYIRHFAPAFRNAARVRMMLFAPTPLRSVLIRLAALGPFARALVRATRIKRSGDPVIG
jgi:flavin-dependent dehydrogenase